jgi:hypothetical protein
LKPEYTDITSRIFGEPKWYDQNGTPRYGKFKPELSSDIYADTVVLLLIACQACDTQFKVEMHNSWLKESVVPRNLHYGDPPMHCCSGGGATMNCEDLEVLEVWHKSRGSREWQRIPEQEGPINISQED